MNPLYTITGMVQKGKQRGKDLGYPTANLQLTQNIPEGIYAAKVFYNNQEYVGATFVGSAKTFGEKEVFIETYVFDFSEDIYGKELTLYLYKKIRENKKFDSVEGLISQMKQDILDIRAFFESF